MMIKRTFYALLLLVVTSVASTSVAFAQDSSFVKVKSDNGFNETVSALKSSVKSHQMMVMGNMNQAKVLSMTGLQLDGAQTFFVGAPAMGKKAFGMNPAAGAVLPTRIYVWAAKGGQTYIGYFKPSEQLTAISPKFEQAGMMVDKKVDAIVSQAAH